MSRQAVACVEFTCDECGTQGEGDMGVCHYQDGERPDGWVVEDDRDICEQCVAKATCAAAGHMWSKWIPDHTPRQVKEYRYCRRCAEAEETRNG